MHLIEGLLANESDIQPSTVHADTQGQSAPVFALATLFGFDMMELQGPDVLPAREHLIYPHIDELFGERGRNIIDWRLIERHWRDLMQVAVSMLRCLADPQLQARITAATNKVESTTGSPTGWRSGTTAFWPATTRPSRRS